MRPIESTSGKAHTTDEDYAKFGGQLVMTVSTTKYDPKLKCWIKRTYEYIDVGRADSVKPLNGDELLEYEKFTDGRTEGSEIARLVNMAAGQARRAKLRDRVVDYMQQYGPETKVALAVELNVPMATLYELLTKFCTDTFCRVGRTERSGRGADIFGLVGVHDKEAA